MLRALAKKAISGSGALGLVARLKPPAALILMYHSVQENPAENQAWIAPGIVHSTSGFARQMELVARRFHPVSLGEIVSFLRGDAKLKRRPVAVTFDDGFLDNVREAAPILRRCGVPAAFYLVTSVIGGGEVPWYCRVRHAFLTASARVWTHSDLTWDLTNPASRDAALQAAYDAGAALAGESQRSAVDRIERELAAECSGPPQRLMMDWTEARALLDAGHTVGSHTVTHPNLAHVFPEESLRSELVDSKRQIESHLNAPVAHFSYPHPALVPQWNQRTLEASRLAGYTTAVTTTRGAVRAGADPLALTRISAPHDHHELLWSMERAFSS
jgi:peptidoglycan/xylan/chitin deacetylase (PgdA/CDA1 family)